MKLIVISSIVISIAISNTASARVVCSECRPIRAREDLKCSGEYTSAARLACGNRALEAEAACWRTCYNEGNEQHYSTSDPRNKYQGGSDRYTNRKH